MLAIRILLVEDNRGDALLIGEALRDEPVELTRVASLRDALARLSADQYDAVLLDLGLPDSAGFETLTAVLGQTRSPVLVLTGLDDEAVGLQAVHQGAQDYLVKGHGGDELLRRAVRYAVERARLQAAFATPLIETAPVGLAVLDRDLRYLYVNPALARMDGLAVSAHLGRGLEEVVPELGRRISRALAGVVARARRVHDLEVTGPTRAGDEARTLLLSADPLPDASGATIGLTMSVVDITERKRREEAVAALAESRSQATAIGESIAFGIWICEPDGGMRYLSESFLDLIGMTLGEAKGFGWMRALAEEAIEPTLQAWQSTVAAEGDWEYEHKVLGIDGRWRTVLSRGLPVRDAAGTVTSWAGINLDITDRKEAESFRDALVGVLSHELRTPITSIVGASTLLRRPAIEPALRDELAADIGEEAERLRRLVDDLLILARAERGTIEVTDEPVLLQHLLPRVVHDFRRRWPDHRFELTLARELPLARGEEALVEQVVRNLVSNAAKYGGPAGPVSVVAEAIDGCPSVRVLDEGPGVEPAEAEQLFGLFYRSPRTARLATGSGIGLFVARRLVEAMDGAIWARPRADRPGAEFGFCLRPVVEEG